ncbi:MAG TPA: endoglucanase [Pseudomonas sp.]|nr:cellulase family glycosylhydrolase [Stutzerimonas xanthomarina]PNF73642.1 endoglucanase [Stutzerimonas stutzeri]HAQ86611.1 endoglucanase [Pseudomonas sp.]
MLRTRSASNRSKGILLGLTVALWSAASYAENIDLVGLNIGGAAFSGNVIPGKYKTNYFFPAPGYFAKWKAKGIETIRFPIMWERLQPALNAELDEDYAELIDQTLQQAAQYDMRIILDIHNYARYRKQLIGTEAVPISAYADLLERVAKRWKDEKGLYAYDIMNEPHGADEYWPAAAQAGIDAIRKHDQKRPLLIEGNFWSSSYRWPKFNDPLLQLEDPSDKLIFSAHLYIDKHGSGHYKEPLEKNFDTMLGVKRVKPFIDWLIKHDKQGHIGEFGIPADEPRYLEAMDNLLAYLQDHCIPITYWAAGSSWGKYKLSIEPTKDGRDRPQWEVLSKYVGQGDCSRIGPNR